MIKVGIIGATGYAGAELVRLLSGHPEAEIVWYGSRSYVDQNFTDIYRNMFTIVEGKCLDDNLPELAREADVIFTATNNGRLIQLLNNLREQMYRYRIEYLKKKECYPQLLAEHRSIIEAIESHDKEKATAITGQHINNQVDTVVGTLRHRDEE